MQTSVTFKNLDPSENLKSYIKDKLNKFDKYLDNPGMATAVLSVEKFRHIAEINITGDRLKINGKEETDDMYPAIDLVLDKLEKQIKKSKQKSRERRGGSRLSSIGIDAEDKASTGAEAAGSGRVRIKNVEYKPMDVEEAILQLDLVKDNFIVFTNSKTERINVLYRRKDGDLGLIQPSM